MSDETIHIITQAKDNAPDPFKRNTLGMSQKYRHSSENKRNENSIYQK
jgi:hypothetical protein